MIWNITELKGLKDLKAFRSHFIRSDEGLTLKTSVNFWIYKMANLLKLKKTNFRIKDANKFHNNFNFQVISFRNNFHLNTGNNLAFQLKNRNLLTKEERHLNGKNVFKTNLTKTSYNIVHGKYTLNLNGGSFSYCDCMFSFCF